MKHHDTNAGRFVVRDLKSGRTFTVECLHDRSDRAHGDWTNGGIDSVKHRGSISPEESQITEANGFTNIAIVGNPMDEIWRRLREGD